MANITATIDLSSVQGKLSALKQGLRNRIIKKAINKGSRVLLSAVKAEIRSQGIIETGLLLRAQGVKVIVRGDRAIAIIGARQEFAMAQGAIALNDKGRARRFFKRTRAQSQGMARKRQPFYYDHLVELGVQQHTVGKGSHLARKLKSGRVIKADQFGSVNRGFPGRNFKAKALAARQAQAEAEMIASIKNDLGNT